MRALTTVATEAPAERARSPNSSSAPSSGGPPAWGWISRACSPLRERSNSVVGIVGPVLDQGPDMAAPTRRRKPIRPRRRPLLRRCRSEEHTSELQSLMRLSYAVFCLKKKKNLHQQAHTKYST